MGRTDIGGAASGELPAILRQKPLRCQQFGPIAVGGRKLHKLLPRGFRLSGITRPLRGRRRAV